MLSHEMQKAICETYEAVDEHGRHVPVQSICAEYNIHAPDLYMILRENGIPMRRALPDKSTMSRTVSKYSEKIRDLVVTMFNDGRGKTMIQISTVTGIPYDHVRKILHHAGAIVLRGRRTNVNKTTIAEIQKMLDSGLNVAETAAEAGVSSSAVLDVIHEYLDKSGGDKAVVTETIIADITSEVLRRVLKVVEGP